MTGTKKIPPYICLYYIVVYETTNLSFPFFYHKRIKYFLKYHYLSLCLLDLSCLLRDAFPLY
jgi:hypothetical protein